MFPKRYEPYRLKSIPKVFTKYYLCFIIYYLYLSFTIQIMPKTKKVTISLSKDEIKSAKKLSVIRLKRENFSGYIAYLIGKDLEEYTSEQTESK